MPWLLLRGLGREQRHWHHFADRLRSRVGADGVRLLDLAGAGTEHGRIPLASVPWLARDVARRLAVRAAERWCVIGLSLGGMVALELCRLLPEHIETAVVINSSARCSRRFVRLRPSALPSLLAIAALRDPLSREARLLRLTSALPAAERARWSERSAGFARDAPLSARALLAQLRAAARFAAPEPAQLSARLLFLGSCNDRLVSPEGSRALAKRYGAPYVEHPWAGHDLPLDDPTWVCERALAFQASPNLIVPRG